jgi:hypothetical protein
MKYLILSVLMLAAVAEARQPSGPCLRFKDVKTLKLHQEGETYIKLRFKTACPVKIQSPDHLPVFEMQNAPGLQSTVVYTSHPGYEHEISTVLTIKASKDAALGSQELHGLIHYQDIVSGNYSDETLRFAVPVKVLRPLPMDTFAHDHPVWHKVLLPIEVAGVLIVYIPFCLFLFITGQGGCQS